MPIMKNQQMMDEYMLKTMEMKSEKDKVSRLYNNIH